MFGGIDGARRGRNRNPKPAGDFSTPGTAPVACAGRTTSAVVRHLAKLEKCSTRPQYMRRRLARGVRLGECRSPAQPPPNVETTEFGQSKIFCKTLVIFNHDVAPPRHFASRSRVVGLAGDDVQAVSLGVRRAVLPERGSQSRVRRRRRLRGVRVTLVSNKERHAHRLVAMDTSSLDGAGGSYLDNSIERRCQDWEASEYYNSTDSCPCLDDPDAEGQVRRTEPSTPETRDPLSRNDVIVVLTGGRDGATSRAKTRKKGFLTPRPAFPVTSLSPVSGACAPLTPRRRATRSTRGGASPGFVFSSRWCSSVP